MNNETRRPPSHGGAPRTSERFHAHHTEPWAARHLRNGDATVPLYGSDEWAALPDDDPRKMAAVVRAAECWRHDSDPRVIAHRLCTELDAIEHAARWPEWLVERIAKSAGRPSHAELCDRRGEPERAARAREHEQRVTADMIVLGPTEGDPYVLRSQRQGADR